MAKTEKDAGCGGRSGNIDKNNFSRLDRVQETKYGEQLK